MYSEIFIKRTVLLRVLFEMAGDCAIRFSIMFVYTLCMFEILEGDNSSDHTTMLN